MRKSITPIQIKEKNKQLIYHFIYEEENVSQQDIAYKLHLSRPTIASKLNELLDQGLIQKNGQIDSDVVGRKAVAYSIIPTYRIALGVEILRKEVKIIAIDLYGHKIDREAFNLLYSNTPAYYEKVSNCILDFISTLKIFDDRILGIGFAMQALTSPDGKRITYGKILECTGLSIDVFKAYLKYPCNFIHDANSAAVAELWTSPELQDAFYLSISKHLGAALITNRNIMIGQHGHSATIEHMQMDPHGSLCYCGKRGCMETLCSLKALLDPLEDLDSFFAKLRVKDLATLKRWQVYLRELARALNSLHLIHDTTFILGGYLAPYLEKEDLDYLYDSIQEMSAFEDVRDFIQISKMPKHNITIGAALTYIDDFLKNL